MKLPFILIALAAALLLPPALRADRVRFDNYGISVEIPEGWQWDSTYRTSGTLELYAHSFNGDARISLMSHKAPQEGESMFIDIPFPMENTNESHEASEIFVGGIRGKRWLGEASKREGDTTVISTENIIFYNNGYEYLIYTTKQSGKPENDTALAGIIGSTVFFDPHTTLYDWFSTYSLQDRSRFFLLAWLAGIGVVVLIRRCYHQRHLGRDPSASLMMKDDR